MNPARPDNKQPDNKRPDNNAPSADPAQLRAAIDDTRKQLIDTIGALVDKADVKARLTQTVRQRVSQAGERGRATVDRIGDSVRRRPSRWVAGLGVLVAVVVGVGAVTRRHSR
jgi:Protein of unknown function (DUF3618)